MFHDVYILVLGTAGVLDTALLLALIERRNRRYVTLWMVLLTLGAWLWHAGAFFDVLLAPSTGAPPPLRWVPWMLMTSGLLLMPSALLHGLLRLWTTGLEVRPPLRLPYGAAYLPLALLVPIGLRLSGNASGEFLEGTEAFVLPYVVWLSLTNGVSAAGLLRLRRSIALPRAVPFFGWLAVSLIGMTSLIAFVTLYAADAWPRAAPWLHLAVAATPVLPGMLFAYYVMRFQFVPIIMERALVYGAIVAGLLLIHRVAVQNLTATLTDRYRVDFGILEGVAGLALILMYQPLRHRTAEALRYLMGSDVVAVRDRTRKLSVEMSALAGEPPDRLLAWFAPAVADALRVESVTAWLMQPSGGVALRCGEDRLSDHDAVALHRTLSSAGLRFCAWHDAPSREALHLLQRAGASAAVVIGHQRIAGLLVLGPHRRNREFGEEERNAVLLLVEQLGSTMTNSLLQGERLTAERRALQNEKLSMLGLLAGSIAHEIRNPLSSIKTIASVLAEETAADGGHTEDLRLILGEIDRLSATTSQLLEFARPGLNDGGPGQVRQALDRTLQIMRHLARQRGVSIETDCDADLPPVSADEPTLREMFFNLLSNSIDAAGPGGRVSVACRQENGTVVAEVRDSGPGIAPEVRDRLFDPFVTTKQTGTGLGLYTVARRLREFGGDIRCESQPGTGTTFILSLPAMLEEQTGRRRAVKQARIPTNPMINSPD